MTTRILTFCLLALICGIAQSQDATISDQLLGSAKENDQNAESTDEAPKTVDSATKDRIAIKNNLKEMALAMLNFESAHESLPARYTKAPDGTRLLSWRVHILPFLLQDELYGKFKLDEPWNSPHNKKLIQEMPDVYKAPGTIGPDLPGSTRFVGIEHAQSALAPPMNSNNYRGQTLARIVSGMSNTIAVVFVAAMEDAVPWTQPVDLRVGIENPFNDVVANDEGIVHCVMLDGSVQSLTKEKYEKDEKLTFFTTRSPVANTSSNAGFAATFGSRNTTSRTLVNQNPYASDSFAPAQPTNWAPEPHDLGRIATQPVPANNPFGYAPAAQHRPNSYRDQLVSGAQATNQFYDPVRERKIQTLQNEALTAGDEKSREQKLTLLKEQLEESFDKSIKLQATELEKLKARVDKLNTAFEKRKTNRDRVIENHIDRIRLQAEGLTMPPGNPQFPVQQFRRPATGTPTIRPTVPQSPTPQPFGNLRPATPFTPTQRN